MRRRFVSPARLRLQARILVAVIVGAATGLVVAGLHAVIFLTWEPLTHRDSAWIAALPVLGLLTATAILHLDHQRSRPRERS